MLCRKPTRRMRALRQIYLIPHSCDFPAILRIESSRCPPTSGQTSTLRVSSGSLLSRETWNKGWTALLLSSFLTPSKQGGPRLFLKVRSSAQRERLQAPPLPLGLYTKILKHPL